MGQSWESFERQPGADARRLGRLEDNLESLIARLERLILECPERADAPMAPSARHDQQSQSRENRPAAAQALAALRADANGHRAPSPAAPASFPAARAALVRERLRQRRAREALFGDVFCDPAWDMLLDLYAAHYEGDEVSVSSLCIAAQVPATTALRHIETMTGRGWLERRADPADKRRSFIRLTDDARTRLDRYFDDLMR
ncbi:winged helix DNA-binding protein [Sphingopyxis terrae]|uniref:winged helix DNA-binding protein n=1 Tax=Sphingopyxis terrae TaxID=33052 RepID=UPI003F80D11A